MAWSRLRFATKSDYVNGPVTWRVANYVTYSSRPYERQVSKTGKPWSSENFTIKLMTKSCYLLALRRIERILKILSRAIAGTGFAGSWRGGD